MQFGQDVSTDESVKDESNTDLVDRGNHEDEVRDEPPTVNDAGELVDSDGNKVFTTVEESIKDGSMVLDSQGRMPGVYLDDLEKEDLKLREERVQNAFDRSTEGTHSVIQREVNVANSPIPPIQTQTKQEHPLTQDTDPDNRETDESSTETEKV